MVRFLCISQIKMAANIPAAVKGSGPDFQVFMLQNNYGGPDS